MDEKLTFLLTFFMLSVALTLTLLLVAQHGRNLRRYRDRQHFHADLYRFIVWIVASMAMYLGGLDWLPSHALSFLPDAVLIFCTTALPVVLLCLISGRWYLGSASAWLVQAFILHHIQARYPGLLHGSFWQLVLQNGLFDLAGLALYLILASRRKKIRREQEQSRHLARYLKWDIK